jgi:hypothetical protein
MYQSAIDVAPDSVYASKSKDRIVQLDATPTP